MSGSIEHQGQESQEGLVEVCSDGRWGTVQTSQPQQVAREVCRRLNFSEINEITSDGKKSISHAQTMTISLIFYSIFQACLQLFNYLWIPNL